MIEILKKIVNSERQGFSEILVSALLLKQIENTLEKNKHVMPKCVLDNLLRSRDNAQQQYLENFWFYNSDYPELDEVAYSHYCNYYK